MRVADLRLHSYREELGSFIEDEVYNPYQCSQLVNDECEGKAVRNPCNHQYYALIREPALVLFAGGNLIDLIL